MNRLHSGGRQLVWDRFPCRQRLHFHKPRGGKRQRVRKRDSSRKTERGLGGETTEMKKKKKSAHNRARKLGPKASKVAKGQK